MSSLNPSANPHTDPAGITSACPACGGAHREPILSMDRVPTSCAQLFATLDQAIQAPDCRLEVVLCPACGHIWNTSHQEEAGSLYNDDYYSSVTATSQGRGYQDALAKDLDGLLRLNGKAVMEIGCGDGYFLSALSDYGASGMGFEPSSTFEVAKNQPGIQVRHERFETGSSANSGFNSDLVVMRHVLEHIPPALNMLKGLGCHKFNGSLPSYLFVEVPNAMHLLQNNLYFDFYNDHVHYFSTPSLVRMAAGAGWHPVESMTGAGEFLRYVFSNGAGHPKDLATGETPASTRNEEPSLAEIRSAATNFRQSFTQWNTDLDRVLRGLREEGRSMAVWGAGARGLALMAGLGLPEGFFEYVVDSDPNKHGKFLPSVHLPVYPPDQLHQQPVDIVLVTSYTYFDEIWSQLEAFRDKGGRVLRVYPQPQLVD